MFFTALFPLVARAAWPSQRPREVGFPRDIAIADQNIPLRIVGHEARRVSRRAPPFGPSDLPGKLISHIIPLSEYDVQKKSAPIPNPQSFPTLYVLLGLYVLYSPVVAAGLPRFRDRGADRAPFPVER
jgi:hypothetical protein